MTVTAAAALRAALPSASLRDMRLRRTSVTAGTLSAIGTFGRILMSWFGKSLFSGSRRLFWVLAPVLALFAISMPLLMAPDEWTLAALVVVPLLSISALLLALMLWDPVQFVVAGRILCGLVFLTYVAYAVSEFISSPEPFRLPSSRGDSSFLNALMGLTIIGLPALWFALLGRFSLQKQDDAVGSEEWLLHPEETELWGSLGEGGATADPVARRINWLVTSVLRHIATSSDGWSDLYVDPADGRYWLLTWPQSQLHGGGPPVLRWLPEKVAVSGKWDGPTESQSFEGSGPNGG